MVRPQIGVLASCLLLAASSQSVIAADYPDSLRGSYECCDTGQYEESIGFEAGLRYVYSRGKHDLGLAGASYSVEDTSHILEGVLRIDDYSTSTFVKARAGYAMAVNSNYATPATGNATTSSSAGTVAYAGIDLAYTPLAGFGGLVGYEYMNESPDMGRVSYATASGGDSDVNALGIHALKLGVVGSGEAGPFSIDGEAALVPYASLSGTYGGFSVANFPVGVTTYQQGSAGDISGSLYGASGELTVGYAPTDNLKLNFGGRVSYLTGSGTVSFTAREVGNPSNAQSYIANTNALSFLRYGVFGGISGTF